MQEKIHTFFINDISNFLISWFHIPSDWAVGISTFILSGTFIAGITVVYKILKFLYTVYLNYIVTKDLSPYFSEQEVKRATRYYIRTKGQNITPTKEEEPMQTHAFVVKQELIPFFKNIAYSPKDDDKFYLILADSGMGKTTFMINLYIKYNSWLNIHFLKQKHKIKLLSFIRDDIDESIKKLISKEEYKNTILLLDAFDEDSKAGKDYQNRLDEVIKLVKDFRLVLITCRTQFFPSQEDEPSELKIKKSYDSTYHNFRKIYVSPFDNDDIQTYLNKKFGLFPTKKKKTAQNIVNKSPTLMVRPMLLNYINYLIEDNISYTYSYQIYETMIRKWIEREANRQPAGKRDKFKVDLYRFSEVIAWELVNNYRNNGFQIPKNLILPIMEVYDIKLDELEITSKSLLTRNASSEWKFAHKSILEYFLAKKLFEQSKIEEILSFNFVGLDQCQTFYREMCFSKLSVSFFSKENNMILYSPSNDLLEDNIKYLKVLNLFSIEIYNYKVKSGENLINLSIESLNSFVELTINYYTALNPSLENIRSLFPKAANYYTGKSSIWPKTISENYTILQDIITSVLNIQKSVDAFIVPLKRKPSQDYLFFSENLKMLETQIEILILRSGLSLKQLSQSEIEKIKYLYLLDLSPLDIIQEIIGLPNIKYIITMENTSNKDILTFLRQFDIKIITYKDNPF